MIFQAKISKTAFISFNCLIVQILRQCSSVRVGLGDMLAKTKNRCYKDVGVNEVGEEVSRRSRRNERGTRECCQKWSTCKE